MIFENAYTGIVSSNYFVTMSFAVQLPVHNVAISLTNLALCPL
jgi:hypothetical protein